MPRQPRTRPVTPAQARSYLGKAQEFLVVAQESVNDGYTLAATSLAVHAGISACDAICGARTGQRAAGSDHTQVVTILNQAGREGKDAARLLTRLMPLKNRAEYEPQDVPKATASRAVGWAERLVGIAQQIIA